jgi:hypothetical protein
MKRLLILILVLISLGSFGQGRIVVKVPSVTIPSSLPSMTGNAGKYLTTDGSTASWGEITARTNMQGWYYAPDYGIIPDDGGDDTDSAQALLDLIGVRGRSATVYFPAGEYLFAKGLQDAADANAQLLLPPRSMDSATLVVNFVGASAPPIQFFTFSDSVPRRGFTVFRSTLSGASGTAAFLAGPTETLSMDGTRQNNVALNVENMIFEAPPNPTFTMLNLQYHQANILRNVLIHTGSVNLQAVQQPTHPNAYGLKVPDYSHTPYNYLENVIVWGHYYGMRLSENTVGNGVRFWANWVGVDAAFGYHPSVFLSLGIYWGPYGIRASGGAADNLSRLRVLLYDIEQANGQGQAWQDMVYEVDDPNNWIVGEIYYESVAGGVGEWTNYPKNGGRNFLSYRVGTNLPYWTTATRPTAGRIGTAGLNTTLGEVEYFNGTAWTVAGGSSIPPDYAAAEVGAVDAATVVVTFSEGIKAQDYAAGAAITVAGAPAVIASADRLIGNTGKVAYVLAAPVAAGQAVTWAYSSLDGDLKDADGYHLPDIAPKAAVNNVGGGGGTPGTTLIEDDFSGSSGNLTAHAITPTNAAGVSWTVGAGAWTTNSFWAIPTHSSVVDHCEVDAGTADGTLTVVTRRSGAADQALMFRYQDPDNYWIADLQAAGFFKIFEKTGGVYTERASAPFAFAEDTDYTIEVVLSGASITATAAGTTTLTYSSTTGQARTRHGLWSSSAGGGSGTRFDNFKFVQ